jgi:hypothetical protein
MKLIDFDGKILWENDTSALIKGNESKVYFQTPAADLLKDFDKRRLVFEAELEAHDKIIAKNLLYFEKPKNLLLPAVDPEIQVEKADGGYRISISAKSLIKNLFLEFPDIDGHFDRNFVDVLSGEKMEVVFETKSEFTDQNLKPAIRTLNMISAASDKMQ